MNARPAGEKPTATRPMARQGKGAKTLGALIAAVGGVLVAFPREGLIGSEVGIGLIVLGLLILTVSLVRAGFR